ncbi:MAG: nicotinate-nucleotide adenylyltransferase [Pirellulaceae bacterium]
MRIGIFGGSFDPIHYAHLILAEQCREQAELDEVWLIPSATAPHKTDGSHADEKQRLQMVEIALAGSNYLKPVDLELKRGGTSFTVDTLEQIRADQPNAELFLLMGGDSLAGFATWKDPERICELAVPLVYSRLGAEADLSLLQPHVNDERLEHIKAMKIQSRLIDISSTDIRDRVAGGKSIRYLLPRGVEAFIESHRLYRSH